MAATTSSCLTKKGSVPGMSTLSFWKWQMTKSEHKCHLDIIVFFFSLRPELLYCMWHSCSSVGTGLKNNQKKKYMCTSFCFCYFMKLKDTQIEQWMNERIKWLIPQDKKGNYFWGTLLFKGLPCKSDFLSFGMTGNACPLTNLMLWKRHEYNNQL